MHLLVKDCLHSFAVGPTQTLIAKLIVTAWKKLYIRIPILRTLRPLDKQKILTSRGDKTARTRHTEKRSQSRGATEILWHLQKRMNQNDFCKWTNKRPIDISGHCHNLAYRGQPLLWEKQKPHTLHTFETHYLGIVAFKLIKTSVLESLGLQYAFSPQCHWLKWFQKSIAASYVPLRHEK